MNVYKVLANRQLAGYAGSDKYINISSNEVLNNLFASLLNGTVMAINNKEISIETKGKTTNIHFTIVDKLLNQEYKSFFAKGDRELRLQLTNYVNSKKVIPGDIITLIIEISGNNCNFYIKSDPIYKYVLEKKAGKNKYRILIEKPHETSNCGITTSEFTDTYLSKFNILKSDEVMTFGKDKTEFNIYTLENCNSKYIGVPYNTDLQCDCFEDIEEIL